MSQIFDQLVTCKICKKYFSNPILLPCGNNICENHLTTYNNDNESIYKCDICFKDHQLPEEGFSLNRPFIEMMNLNIHFDEQTRKTVNVIENLNNVNKTIDLLIKDPNEFIYSYFFECENRIDLKEDQEDEG